MHDLFEVCQGPLGTAQTRPYCTCGRRHAPKRYKPPDLGMCTTDPDIAPLRIVNTARQQVLYADTLETQTTCSRADNSILSVRSSPDHRRPKPDTLNIWATCMLRGLPAHMVYHILYLGAANPWNLPTSMKSWKHTHSEGLLA